MKWFLNISTRSKLLIAFFIMILIMGIIMTVSYRGINSIHNAQKTMIDVEFPMSLEIVKLRNALNRERIYMSRLMMPKERASLEQWGADIKEADSDIAERFSKLKELSQNAPKYSESIQELISNRVNYKKIWDTQILPLVIKGKRDDADVLFLGAHLEQFEKMREIAIHFSDISEQKDKELKAQSEKIVAGSISVFVITGIAAILAGIIMAVFITHIISVPLQKASEAAEKIAYGDLTAALPSIERKDETGRLMMSFGMMLESLRMVTQEIKSSVDILSTSTKPEELKKVGEKLKRLTEQYKV